MIEFQKMQKTTKTHKKLKSFNGHDHIVGGLSNKKKESVIFRHLPAFFDEKIIFGLESNDFNFVKLEGVPIRVPRELPDLGAEHFLNFRPEAEIPQTM